MAWTGNLRAVFVLMASTCMSTVCSEGIYCLHFSLSSVVHSDENRALLLKANNYNVVNFLHNNSDCCVNAITRQVQEVGIV